MQITKENYELYAIDYLEGGLTGEELRCMESFLDEHPEIKSELLGLEAITLLPEEKISFTNKEKLLKKEPDGAFPWLWTAVSVIFIALLIPFVFWQQAEPKVEQIADKNTETVSEKAVQTEIPQKEAAVVEKTAADIGKNNTAAINNTDKKTNATDSQTGENNAKSPVKIETSTEMLQQLKRQAESDSLKKILDSLQLQNDKPKLEFSAMPLAGLELKELEINKKEIVLSPKMLLELTSLQNNGKNIAKVKKPKSFKTPFGTIRFNDIRDALLPESYIAAVK